MYQISEQQNSQIFHPEHVGSSFVRTLGSNYGTDVNARRQQSSQAKGYYSWFQTFAVF